jgi:hypothetical protein
MSPRVGVSPTVEQGPLARVQHDQPRRGVLVDLEEHLGDRSLPGRHGNGDDVVERAFAGQRLGALPQVGVPLGGLHASFGLLEEHPQGLGDGEVEPGWSTAASRRRGIQGAEALLDVGEGVEDLFGGVERHARGVDGGEQLGFGGTAFGLGARDQRVAVEGGGHAQRRVGLAGLHAPPGEDAVEFVGAAVGGVLGDDVGGGDLPEALHGPFVAVQQAGGQELFERDGEGNVTDAD